MPQQMPATVPNPDRRSRPPRRVDLKKLERRRIPAPLLVAGVAIGNALLCLGPYPQALHRELAIYNLVILALGLFYKRPSVIGAALAGALLAGPLAAAVAG